MNFTTNLFFIRYLGFLDDNLKQKYFGEELDDISMKIENFEELDFEDIPNVSYDSYQFLRLRKIFMVENEINYLTFPQIKIL
ncbi:MAG: hypothetical protein Q9M97_10675 [Candidatus Gracilibacteria bacterium]|nr:hypothetical protein [Candidatus Gracilibacteria bacterium]